MLLLLDRNSLIDVFNEPVDPINPRSLKVFEELCKRIKEGNQVEELCNVITSVSETFWDLEKVMKFYDSLNSLLRSQPHGQGLPNWLVHIQNPLLFYIALIYYFT